MMTLSYNGGLLSGSLVSYLLLSMLGPASGSPCRVYPTPLLPTRNLVLSASTVASHPVSESSNDPLPSRSLFTSYSPFHRIFYSNPKGRLDTGESSGCVESLRAEEVKLRNVEMKIGRGRNCVFRRTLQLRDEIYRPTLSLSYFLPLCIFLSLSLLRWNIGRYSLLTFALACKSEALQLERTRNRDKLIAHRAVTSEAPKGRAVFDEARQQITADRWACNCVVTQYRRPPTFYRRRKKKLHYTFMGTKPGEGLKFRPGDNV
ncbi:hypothetical protein EVAR_7106_1 [Eumeta japonica]|uniref:Uncharacterized protein n=1 Tax=Eumeta variegata TaxID=151549 RepID=A0A4C2A1Z0_EUMVA|nr:hypothetical protein EVAR_7106_1 [Eumeta japonica]